MTRIDPPTLAEIEAAAGALAGILVPTPLVPHRGPEAPQDVWLKPEIRQRIGSFKIRGVFHAVAGLTAAERARGLSTVSAGNTARALAWAGRHFGVPARSLMPDTAPPAKIDAVRAWGGEPVLVPVERVFAFLRERRWEQEPYAFVHPWISREVMTGHATMGLEIVAERPDLDVVYVPVGGGGLIAGVGTAIRALRPAARIVAVEPEGCPSLHESLRRGEPAEVPCRTICDGVAVPYITDEMFPLLRDLVSEVVLVPDEAVRTAMARLLEHDGMVVEPSGALALAAALARRGADGRVSVCIVSGGGPPGLAVGPGAR